MKLYRCGLAGLLLFCVSLQCFGDENDPSGMEVSWPMQHETAQHEPYDAFMKGCAEQYSTELCEKNDSDRIQLNARQPLLQTNFTNTGYAVVSLPSPAWEVLERFWHGEGQTFLHNKEHWEQGSIYTNHWEAPSYYVEFADDNTLVTEHVQSVLETWCKSPLVPTSTYGVRVYTNGSILSPHIDRVPLVISAIVNVAQDVQEDWILQVISHQGKAVNLTLQPGEMVLYESHSIIHGRPYALKGSYYANMFFHFEPIGYTQALQRRLEATGYVKTNQQLFAEAQTAADTQPTHGRRQRHKLKSQFDLPYYIEDGTEEASRWRQEFIYRRQSLPAKPKVPVFRPVHERPHHLAAKGHLDRLKALANSEPGVLDEADANGWKPLHEAARAGRYKVLKYLIEEHNVDVNERTNHGSGGSPLWWAEKSESGDPEVVKLLKKHGAKAIAPE